MTDDDVSARQQEENERTENREEAFKMWEDWKPHLTIDAARNMIQEALSQGDPVLQALFDDWWSQIAAACIREIEGGG